MIDINKVLFNSFCELEEFIDKYFITLGQTVCNKSELYTQCDSCDLDNLKNLNNSFMQVCREINFEHRFMCFLRMLRFLKNSCFEIKKCCLKDESAEKFSLMSKHLLVELSPNSLFNLKQISDTKTMLNEDNEFCIEIKTTNPNSEHESYLNNQPLTVALLSNPTNVFTAKGMGDYIPNTIHKLIKVLIKNACQNTVQETSDTDEACEYLDSLICFYYFFVYKKDSTIILLYLTMLHNLSKPPQSKRSIDVDVLSVDNSALMPLVYSQLIYLNFKNLHNKVEFNNEMIKKCMNQCFYSKLVHHHQQNSVSAAESPFYRMPFNQESAMSSMSFI